jgi:hypothetical protein
MSRNQMKHVKSSTLLKQALAHVRAAALLCSTVLSMVYLVSMYGTPGTVSLTVQVRIAHRNGLHKAGMAVGANNLPSSAGAPRTPAGVKIPCLPPET